MKTFENIYVTAITFLFLLSSICDAEDRKSAHAILIDRIFREYEVEIPSTPRIRERSLVVESDGKFYSVAQLGELTNRVIPNDDDSRKVAWKYTESSKPIVRYIACCAIFRDAKVRFSSLPDSISIFDSMTDQKSEKFQNLIQWINTNVRKNS